MPAIAHRSKWHLACHLFVLPIAQFDCKLDLNLELFVWPEKMEFQCFIGNFVVVP